MVLETRRVIFNPVNKTSIPSIRIYITDGLRRPVYFNNACADTSISLILKEILIDNYMKTRDFKKQLSPNFGNVYEHTGNGLIVDNILKPIYEHRGNGLIVNNILKPIKSGIKAANKAGRVVAEKLGKKLRKKAYKTAKAATSKLAEKSGDIIRRGEEQGGKTPFSLLSEPIFPSSLLFEPISPSSLNVYLTVPSSIYTWTSNRR